MACWGDCENTKQKIMREAVGAAPMFPIIARSDSQPVLNRLHRTDAPTDESLVFPLGSARLFDLMSATPNILDQEEFRFAHIGRDPLTSYGRSSCYPHQLGRRLLPIIGKAAQEQMRHSH